MKAPRQIFTALTITGLLIFFSIPGVSPQSQSLNGQIEGTVTDKTSGALPNAQINVTNIETGAFRNTLTDENGVFRFPLLPLGTYRIAVEAARFKKFVREGVNLAAGQNATIDYRFGNRRYQQSRHGFGRRLMSLVARSKFNFGNKLLRLLFNDHQFGVISAANSGERFNITANFDLNRDGMTASDRTVSVSRNSGKTPPQYNLDLRYSRFFSWTEHYRLEVFGEIQNLFNISSMVEYNNVPVRDFIDTSTGKLIAPPPDFKARDQSVAQENRQLQLGIKFIF